MERKAKTDKEVKETLLAIDMFLDIEEWSKYTIAELNRERISLSELLELEAVHKIIKKEQE